MRISDWSADVCASDLRRSGGRDPSANAPGGASHGKGGEIGGATFGFRSLCRWCPAVRSLCCGGSGEGRLSVRLRRQVRALPGRRSPGPKDQAHLLREPRGVGVGRGRQGNALRHGAHQDRKSVVEGKSVSVRLDLGGRRIIKKKKKEQ